MMQHRGNFFWVCLALAFFIGESSPQGTIGRVQAQSKKPTQDQAPGNVKPATPSGAPAEDRWVSRCGNDGRQSPLICSVESVVPIPNTPQLFLNVSVEMKPGKTRPLLRIQSPLAVLLEPGINLKFGDGQSRRLNFEYCEQRGCIASSELAPEMVDALRQGSQMIASFQTATQQSYDIVIPTKNFGAAFARIE
jgi:invasion protein IalB